MSVKGRELRLPDEPIPISCDLCDSCETVFSAPAYNLDGILEEWVCSGLITKPLDKKDVHDSMNTIRLCVVKPGGLTSHEWTTWEGSIVAVALNMAVAVDLEKNQPTLDRVEELTKLGYTDQNNQKKEREEDTQ